MAPIDLLEELQLNDFYPQKLSFSEAIKLREKSQNGCQRQYGLEILRKLLMYDSTAVVSVISEINERLSNTGNNETEIKGQCVSDRVRPPQKDIVRRSRRRDKAERSVRNLHPMDLLVVVMNCCDDFLRQILVEKMFVNKLSIPILLPDVRNCSHTLLLFALKSLVPEVQGRTRKSSTSLTDTLVDVENPVVSFIRVGDLHRSKSKLLNDLLNPNSFNTFFHRDCANGSVKRSVSNGSIEAAWFQSSTPTEEQRFNCSLFTVLNLRGDAKDYPNQTQFLCQSSTLTVLMVDSFESFKALYEKVLKDVDVSQTKIIVCCISRESPDKGNETNFELWEDRSGHIVLSDVNYDWNDEEKMNDVDFTNDFRQTICEFLKPEHTHSDQMPSYINIIQRGKNLGFSLDEDKIEYKSGKASAEDFIDSVLKQPTDCKPKILPLQGEPWKQIRKLEREQRRKPQDKSQDEHFIAEKETEKRHQRQIQCCSLIQQHEITQQFSLKFHSLPDQNLLYYLDSCKIKLDARNRIIISSIIAEYKIEQEHHQKLSHEKESEVKLRQMELKIANSAIGLEHILREHGQMYEAVISEEIRMKEEFKNAPLKPDVIRNFPRIAAGLLLKGQPLELMDGDASNVPITWLKAVLNQINFMTSNAKLFVLSIIGVQSSGKSTLLNALFGLQFPVSAGRCTKGIYCHLVPVDKGSLILEYNYVLVVDTEGLGASEFTRKSTFRDNELATFAIGLADATIINMKGENWSEMKDILQIVAYGLIRVRKTKAELKLMPRCMFVHQNVPAADAEEKNWMDQEKQLMLLDEAIKTAGSKEGFTEITKFNQVIKYDPKLHSWYFPDIWNGRPPKARVSPDYIGKVNELRQYLVQLMKNCPSKLTISSFYLRMSDLWNAMLHNDFVLSFRNTQEIVSVTILNDRISHEVDNFKILNKRELTRICKSVRSNESIEKLFKEGKGKILRKVSDAVEKNFTNMKSTLKGVIDSTDICAALKQKYETSLIAIKAEELFRIEDEARKVINVRMKKLEYANDRRVKDLNAKLVELEKCIEEVEKAKLNEKGMTDFEKKWQDLIDESKVLVDERMKLVESEIKETIRQSITEWNSHDENQLDIVEWVESLKTLLVVKMPQVTESDIVQEHKLQRPTRWVMDFVYWKSYVHQANSNLYEAYKKWDMQFRKKKGLEFDASHLEQVMFEVGQLLGIFTNVQSEGRPGADEICSILPPGYRFKRDYITGFVQFVCHDTYKRSLENNKRFISLTDPLADIGERRNRSISKFRLLSAEANIDAVSKQIFDFAKGSFVSNLGEFIKIEVCKGENKDPTFKSKRAFLRTILADLGQKTKSLADLAQETTILEYLAQKTKSLSELAQTTKSLADLAQKTKSLEYLAQKTKSLADLAQKTKSLADLAQETKSLPDLAHETKSLAFIAQYRPMISSADLAQKTKSLADLAQKTKSLADLAQKTKSLADLAQKTESLADIAQKTKSLADLAQATKILADLAQETKVLADLAQKTKSLADLKAEKTNLFEEFMLYVELAETETSENFFLNVLSKLLKEKLTKKCGTASQTDIYVQKLVENDVGKVAEIAKNALKQAETNCKECRAEYIRIFKEYMNVTSEIDFGIHTLSGFTEAVVEKIDILYASFSLFETLVCEDNRAAIRPLFDKIMGCRRKCPFCSAPCSQSLNLHAGDHRANHYPMGVRGTVDIPGWFTDTQETPDATEEKQKKPRKLTLSTCQAMVGTRIDVRTVITVNKATKWYQSDYQPFKKYKEIQEYKDWDIPYCLNHDASLYWKWFMAQFGQELAEHYNALCPVIPEAWKNITWEEAIKSLDEPDLKF